MEKVRTIETMIKTLESVQKMSKILLEEYGNDIDEIREMMQTYEDCNPVIDALEVDEDVVDTNMIILEDEILPALKKAIYKLNELEI